MEICKNKKTGQAFVYLDEQENGKALMITPHGDVKTLTPDLFTEPIEVDDGKVLVNQGQITVEQYNIYNQYHQQ